MTLPFIDPFQDNTTDPLCSDVTCTPCVATPDPTGCFICGYDHDAFEDCKSSHYSTPCLGGAVECLDCETTFENSNIQFLGGYVSGFSSKLGYGASESSVSIDLVVMRHDCQVTPSGCSTPPVCTNDVYTGQIGYVYTFQMGSFCFRGILTNHSYTEDSSGFKYKLNLGDGRSVLGGTSVLLNGFYDPVPDDLQPNLINLIRESEPSVYNDQCGLLTKCDDFMSSGSNQKGILLKKAIEKLDGKCVSVPVSGAALTINLKRLIPHVNEQARTTNQESTALELIDLACQESGLGFYTQLNNDNEIEIFPINYKIDLTGTDLFQFVENLNNNDIVISKDYGQEMTFEKAKRVLYGSEYCYLTLIRDKNKNSCIYPVEPENPLDDCAIEYAPWQQPNVRSDHPDFPIQATPPTGC